MMNKYVFMNKVYPKVHFVLKLLRSGIFVGLSLAA